MQNIEILKQFIMNELAAEKNLNNLDENQSLLETGILDSLSILKLVTFIETNFKIKVEDEDVIPENFETLFSLSKMILMKKEISL